MRLLWLADVLRNAGLTVHEVDGWRTRGADTYGPVVGVQIHETRGSLTSTDAGEIKVLLNGSNTAPPPIAQLYLSRTADWWVVASGTCYHNKIGWAGPNEGYGNDALLGIEAQHAGAEPWTELQYRSYVRGTAALVAKLGCGPGRVSGHKEHQPGDKTDPLFDMAIFRRDVAAVLNGDDVALSDLDAQALIWRVEALINNRATVAGGPTAGEENKVHTMLASLAVGSVDAVALAATVADRLRPTIRDAVADLGEGGAAAVRAGA